MTIHDSNHVCTSQNTSRSKVSHLSVVALICWKYTDISVTYLAGYRCTFYTHSCFLKCLLFAAFLFVQQNKYEIRESEKLSAAENIIQVIFKQVVLVSKWQMAWFELRINLTWWLSSKQHWCLPENWLHWEQNQVIQLKMKLKQILVSAIGVQSHIFCILIHLCDISVNISVCFLSQYRKPILH